MKKTIIRIYTGKKSQKDVPRDRKKKRVKFIIFSCEISLKLGLNKKLKIKKKQKQNRSNQIVRRRFYNNYEPNQKKTKEFFFFTSMEEKKTYININTTITNHKTIID